MINKNQIGLYVFGSIISIGFFTSLFLFMTVEIPVNNIQSINIILGALVGAFVTVVGFFFGSSKGSHDKNIK